MKNKKVAIITGGSKGIGKAITLRLLLDDYHVIVVYRSDDDAARNLTLGLSEVVKKKCHLIKCDLSNPTNINYLIEQIKFITTEIDVLILNTGSTNRKDLADISIDEWNDVINTNLTIPVFIIQKLSLLLRDYSTIIFTGSLMAMHPHSVSLPYAVSKAGVHSLVKNLVKSFASRGIRVNAVAPGFVDTKWQNSKPDEIKNRIKKKIALHRFAETDEIADAFIFLLNNNYINGEVIKIDGGYSFE